LQVHAEYFDITGAGFYKRQQHSYGGRLACAILTQESIDISFFHRKREVINRFYTAEIFAQMPDLEDYRHSRNTHLPLLTGHYTLQIKTVMVGKTKKRRPGFYCAKQLQKLIPLSIFGSSSPDHSKM
jgi:hypothetical protein